MSDAKQSEPPSSNPILAFLNTNLGLALVAFVLTTLVGSTITYVSHALDDQRQHRIQKHEKSAARRIAARTYAQKQDAILKTQIASPMLQRELRTEMMAQLFGRETKDEEYKDVWNTYWVAYRSYFLFVAGNVIPRDRGFGPPANYLDQHTVLWTYFEDAITPEFDAIHNCVVHAQAIYDPRAARPNKGADVYFKDCVQKHFAGRPFWISKWDDGGGPDAWGRMKKCVNTFVLQIESELIWREQLASERNTSETAHDLKTCSRNYKGSRWCREVEFNQDTYNEMKKDCGSLPPCDVADLAVYDKNAPAQACKERSASQE